MIFTPLKVNIKRDKKKPKVITGCGLICLPDWNWKEKWNETKSLYIKTLFHSVPPTQHFAFEQTFSYFLLGVIT